MSNPEEYPDNDPVRFPSDLPIQLFVEPPDRSIDSLAQDLFSKDPRILPALGALAASVNLTKGTNQVRGMRLAVLCFALGCQYADTQWLRQLFNEDEAPPTDLEN